MTTSRYSLSFTTGSLFHPESVELAGLYLDLGDWKPVRDQVVSENLLQSRTLSSLHRMCAEIFPRLQTLNPGELAFLVAARHQEQAYLLWIAVCRRFSFIAEFAIEVLRERYITLKADLSPADFDAFFNRKAEWHPELEGISPATRIRLRQVLFKMLREADLLTSNNRINAAIPTPGFLSLIAKVNRREVLYFPIFESDLQGRVP